MICAPTDIEANLKYRQEILELGQTSQSAREEIWLAAARDANWFSSVFLYGFNPRDFPDSPQRPFIPYDFQRQASDRIGAAIGKHNLVIPKCRAVGGTYIVLSKLFHRWMFRPMQSFLLASAKEDRVDEFDDPDCLFWKLRHFITCLPKWMRPPTEDIKLRLYNPETESVFNGETTNQNLGRGGRRTAILLDEAAAMANGEKVIASVLDISNTSIFLSTPKGAFGGFHSLFQKYQKEAPNRVIMMPWTDHPIYSVDLEYDGDGKPTSPWYREKCLNAPGPRYIAQEIDMSFNASGGPFFEPELVEKLLKQIRQPVQKGEIMFDREDIKPKWTKSSVGKMLVWCPVDSESPAPGAYVVGCDISMGVGGSQSSQSTISVYNALTGEKAAEYKNNRIAPSDFAWYAVAVCRWFHNAKLIWGSQGPGSTFGKVVIEDCRYFRVYMRGDPESLNPRKTRRYGYPEQGPSREIMFGNYRDALSDGRIRNFSREAIEELRMFIFATDGTVQHSAAIQKDQDPENKGRLHGDIVISDALSWQLLRETMKTKGAQKKEAIARYGSFAWRMNETEKAMRDKADWASTESFAW